MKEQKVLWLTNIILPKIAEEIHSKKVPGGGWLVGLADDLIRQPEIKLAICAPDINTKKIISGKLEGLSYYCFPQTRSGMKKYNHQIEVYLKRILQEVDPDVIHIFGTEYPHTLAMVTACKELGIEDKIVINIQGLVSIYAQHYEAGLTEKIVNSTTLRNFIAGDNIRQKKKEFEQRGMYEIAALKEVQHVIGRTDWDQACTMQINPKLHYHFCNETLRPTFYKDKWNIETCSKYSIFISQCSYPIKGFHYMLEAMAEIIKKYPNAHIYTTGNNPLEIKSIKEKIKVGAYQKYLGKLIKKYHLENHVTFLGMLNEQEMKMQFLNSHIFVSPSVIENSPNSVGEAMLLGVPTISSDVGGVKNMLKHEEDGFIYQADAPYMLSYYVDKIFSDDKSAIKLSINSQKHAKKTHDKESNLKEMIEIYKKIK